MCALSGTGRLVDVGDTLLHVVERGEGSALLVLHGGPGLDHHEFADYLDPLANRHRLILVDQAGARAIAAGIPGARLEVFEHSAHMAYVEEQARYLDAVRSFLAEAP